MSRNPRQICRKVTRNCLHGGISCISFRFWKRKNYKHFYINGLINGVNLNIEKLISFNLVNKKKKKWQIFARQRNGNGALQVAAFSRSLPSLSERRRAPLNLIDETVLVEDYPSVFSANFPLPPRIEKRDDSSQILPTHSRCTFHGTLAERQRKGKAIAGCNKCPAISKRREGHGEETIDFPRISISKTPEPFDENVRNGWP